MSESGENVRKPVRSAGRIIARNTVFGVAAQIVLKFVSFLFGVLIVHRIGDAEFGQYSIVLAWTGLFSVLGDLGITQYFAREIAREPKKTSELFWDMVTLRGILALVAAAVTTFGAILHPYLLGDRFCNLPLHIDLLLASLSPAAFKSHFRQ